MLIVFVILVILSSIILGLIILVQNPQGGGLSASMGGFSNQLMGVKQTTDVLEKGTWIFAAVVGVICLISPAFIPKNGGTSSKTDNLLNSAPATVPMPQQNNTVPIQQGSAPQPAPATK
ncbi:MAG TPA: preprotein translocase subunit SecG [Ferruginibacter sp.]|jgi:preprotein translocase subunit SecG|nr:preprotein translocase subunit SecG [Ferruginibacter sp.]